MKILIQIHKFVGLCDIELETVVKFNVTLNCNLECNLM